MTKSLSPAILVELALDLVSSLHSENRFDRLLSTIRKAIRCDAVALLSCQQNRLKPISIQGLSPDTLGRRFEISEHPRLAAICHSDKPLRFAADSPLPDPYDGLLLAQPGDLQVHACMGLPLIVERELIGVVTLDSLTPGVFDNIDSRTLEVIATLSAATLRSALQFSHLEHQAAQANELVQELTHEALTRDGGDIIGQSPLMLNLKQEIKLVASSDFSVLIEGETGVGKELVARSLHQLSTRHQQPLIHLNCASLPQSLAESELFGHVKGAFTGAGTDRPGKFRLADHGTIFLDEVGELPLSLQSKLLRVLQSGEIQPVGQDETQQVDVRIIAATNRDLQQEVSAGRFRADLYHRLSVYPIKVPELRNRGEDVILLAGYFLEQTARKLGIRQLKLAPETMELLQHYTWPGNVRELEHIVSRAALKARGEQGERPIITLKPQHCDMSVAAELSIQPPPPSRQNARGLSLKQSTELYKKACINTALEQHQGNWSLAAKHLQMDRANLTRLAKRLGIMVNRQIISQ